MAITNELPEEYENRHIGNKRLEGKKSSWKPHRCNPLVENLMESLADLRLTEVPHDFRSIISCLMEDEKIGVKKCEENFINK